MTNMCAENMCAENMCAENMCAKNMYTVTSPDTKGLDRGVTRKYCKFRLGFYCAIPWTYSTSTYDNTGGSDDRYCIVVESLV